MTAFILACLALAPGAAETITTAEYRVRLERLEAEIERGDLDAARESARGLLASRVRHPNAELPPDSTVLRPVLEAKDAAAARAAAARIKVLIRSLESAEGPAAEPPDHELLEYLRRDEAANDIRRGGEVGTLPQVELPKSFRVRLAEFRDWLLDLLRRFVEWIFRHFLSVETPAGQPHISILTVALVAAILITLGAIAIVALRRHAADMVPTKASFPSQATARDEDPLSRTALEWERYGGELLRAGRYREAIRAWYHAILVTCFGAGILHYRKDRTNWEYVRALPRDVSWTGGFFDATRSFEYEWYGRRDTASETAEAFARRAQEILSIVRPGGIR